MIVIAVVVLILVFITVVVIVFIPYFHATGLPTGKFELPADFSRREGNGMDVRIHVACGHGVRKILKCFDLITHGVHAIGVDRIKVRLADGKCRKRSIDINAAWEHPEQKHDNWSVLSD